MACTKPAEGDGVTRTPGPCNARACDNPFTRLYPCGWRCREHAPVPETRRAA